MSSILTKLSDFIFGDRFSATRTLVSVGAASFVALFIAAYRDWRALGPGGLPYSFRGFLTVLYVHVALARYDTRKPDHYRQLQLSAPEWTSASEAERRAARESHLPASGLPVREGPKSRARFWAIPQRERDVSDSRNANEEIRKAYLAAVEQLVGEYQDSLKWQKSVLETRGQAVFLKERPPPDLATRTRGEVLHVHASDLSGHVTLSITDAEEVIRKGYGERHRLGGNRLHLGYTFLFVPRTMQEIDLYVGIFRAGIKYMLRE